MLHPKPIASLGIQSVPEIKGSKRNLSSKLGELESESKRRHLSLPVVKPKRNH